jgi:hypothetical protein
MDLTSLAPPPSRTALASLLRSNNRLDPPRTTPSSTALASLLRSNNRLDLPRSTLVALPGSVVLHNGVELTRTTGFVRIILGNAPSLEDDERLFGGLAINAIKGDGESAHEGDVVQGRVSEHFGE